MGQAAARRGTNVILVLLYHRINHIKYSNSLVMFQSHVRLLANRYPIALPGDPVIRGKMTLCLTFDDASFDFYHYIFPLLSELGIKTILAVPVKYIVEDTNIASSVRLQVPYDEAMKEGVYQERVPFCTWSEISEMVKSGYVEVASHSYSHIDLTGGQADLNREIVESKVEIEERLGRKVTTFVYPFGRVDGKVLQAVRRHYTFSMRVGYALNRDWQNAQGMIYRVSADNLPDPGYPLRKNNLLKYYFKYLSNTVRGR